MRLERQPVQLSIAIIVSNSQLIVIILDMHILRLLKGEFKCLLMFHSNHLGNRIPLEHILIILPIQVQDLLDHRSILKEKLMELHGVVIDEKAAAVGAVGVVVEGDFDDVLAHLKGYIVFGRVLVDDGGD